MQSSTILASTIESFPWDLSSVCWHEHETAPAYSGTVPGGKFIGVRGVTQSNSNSLHHYGATSSPDAEVILDDSPCQDTTMSQSNGIRKDDSERPWGVSAAHSKILSPVPMGVSPWTVNTFPSNSTINASNGTPPPRRKTRTSRRAKRPAPSRNRQANDCDQVESIRIQLSHCRIKGGERPKNLACHFEACPYVQYNGRLPELRRHIKSHLPKKIRCVGVPWPFFDQNRQDFPHVPEFAQPYTIPEADGFWVGGCLKTFSRNDALKRHQRNTLCAGVCLSDWDKPLY